MESVIGKGAKQRMFLHKRERTVDDTKDIRAVLEYTPGQLARELTKELEGIEDRFDLATDPDMIDSYIYEHAALTARLRYLLRVEREGEMEYPRLVEPNVAKTWEVNV